MKVWNKNEKPKRNEQLELFFPLDNIEDKDLPYYNSKTGHFDKEINVVSMPLHRAMHPSPELQEIIHYHSVFCQVSMPFKDLKDNNKVYVRRNGNITLTLESLYNEEIGTHPGLPFGPIGRLLIMFINTYSIQHKTQVIDIMRSLNDFISRILELPNSGQYYKKVRNQLMRLLYTNIIINYSDTQLKSTYNTKMIKNFEFDKNTNNCYIKIEDEYYHSLLESAVPLDEMAIKAISNNSMAMDIYVWLAHRLHRIKNGSQFVPWTSLQQQFGQNYSKMFHFKSDFRKNLHLATSVYENSYGKISEDMNKGLVLRPAKPPIDKKIHVIK